MKESTFFERTEVLNTGYGNEGQFYHGTLPMNIFEKGRGMASKTRVGKNLSENKSGKMMKASFQKSMSSEKGICMQQKDSFLRYPVCFCKLNFKMSKIFSVQMKEHYF